MTTIILSDLPIETLAKLETQAQAHGRSLQEEIRHILETVVAQSTSAPQTMEAIRVQATCLQQQLHHHAQLTASQPQPSPEQPLNLVATLETLRLLKQTISSLGELTIRQAIEEGRQF